MHSINTMCFLNAKKLIIGDALTMNKISIVMIEDNVELCNTFEDYFGNSEEFEFYGCAHNAEDGFNLISDKQPDIAVMDVILPIRDGLSILEKIQEEDVQVKPINVIFTRANSEMMISEAISLGADYIFLKPFDLNIMKKRLLQMYEHKCTNSSYVKGNKRSNPPNTEKTIEEKITILMFDLGISSHLKGYKYIKHAIILSMKNEEILESVTKLLYPEIAKHFGTNRASVEHAIRNAIGSGWGKSNKNNKIERYKQLGFDPLIQNKPTNRTLIYSMVQYLS